MKSPVLIWGASGHASSVAEVLRQENHYEIVGFLTDSPAPEVTSAIPLAIPSGETFQGLPLFRGRQRLRELRIRGVKYLAWGFGNCQARLALSEVARQEEFDLVSAVHPQAIVASDVEIGAGSIVMAGAILNVGCRIGESVIINSGAVVEHGCVIGDGVHLCPGTTLAGGVHVGRAAWIGVGAAISDHITIGEGAVVGAGSVVVRDVPSGVVAYGVPAKVRRSLSKND